METKWHERRSEIGRSIDRVTGEIAELNAAIGGLQLKLNAPTGVAIDIQGTEGDLLSQIADGIALKAAQQSAAEAEAELRSMLQGAISLRAAKQSELDSLRGQRSGVQQQIDSAAQEAELRRIREEYITTAERLNNLAEQWNAAPQMAYAALHPGTSSGCGFVHFVRIWAHEHNPRIFSVDMFGKRIAPNRK